MCKLLFIFRWSRIYYLYYVYTVKTRMSQHIFSTPIKNRRSSANNFVLFFPTPTTHILLHWYVKGLYKIEIVNYFLLNSHYYLISYSSFLNISFQNMKWQKKKRFYIGRDNFLGRNVLFL